MAPEDGVHHEQICSFLNVPSLPLLRLDLTSAPSLFERVRLAKKVNWISSFTDLKVDFLAIVRDEPNQQAIQLVRTKCKRC